MVKDLSNKINVPIILHLDHAEEISSIVRAIKCGFTSLMFDGPPGIDFAEKIAKTKKVVEVVHSVGLMVEAELGYITRVGIDDKAAIENIADPDLAQEFVEKTQNRIFKEGKEKHSNFMEDCFVEAGLKSVLLHGTTKRDLKIATKSHSLRALFLLLQRIDYRKNQRQMSNKKYG